MVAAKRTFEEQTVKKRSCAGNCEILRTTFIQGHYPPTASQKGVYLLKPSTNFQNKLCRRYQHILWISVSCHDICHHIFNFRLHGFPQNDSLFLL